MSRQAQLGLQGLTNETIKEWMCENTERANLLLPAAKGPFVLALLEAFMQCRLNPVFEGSASQTEGRAVSLPWADHDTPANLATIAP